MHRTLGVKARNRRLDDAKSKTVKFVICEVDKGREKRSVAKGDFDLLHVLKNGVMDATVRMFPASPSLMNGSSRELFQLRMRISYNDEDTDHSSMDTDTSHLTTPAPSSTTMNTLRTTSHMSFPVMQSSKSSHFDTTDVLSADSHDFTDNTLSSLKISRDTEDLAVQVTLPTQDSLHFQKKLTESQNDAAELQRKLMKISHQHDMNVEKLQSQMRSLQMENEDLESRLDRIQLNNTTLNADLAKVQNQLQRTDGEKNHLSSDNDVLRSKEVSLRSALEALQLESKKLELKYTKKKKDYTRKKMELAALRASNDDSALKSKSLEKRMQTGSLCLSFMLLGGACGFLYILSLPFINFQYKVVHDRPPLDFENHFTTSLESITKSFVMSTVIIAALSAFGLRFSRRYNMGTCIIDYIMNPYSLATSEMKSQVRNSSFLGCVSALILCIVGMFLATRDDFSTSHTFEGKKVFLISFALYQALVEEIVGRVFFFSLCREVMVIISSKSKISKTQPSAAQRTIYAINEWALKMPFVLPALFSALLHGLFWEMGLFGRVFSIFNKSTPHWSLVTMLLFIGQHFVHAHLYKTSGKIELVIWMSFISHML
eukprot:CAMPEP_0117447878 /NCGR_PEP_ID=MMETSP0759-20121206/7104_1 /TAXON_ID=63605 /ORGANISM="Percolomonas cosmopolitus, Strain WS" /LENGTH=600 /DNA_ID=CAMNT_0005240231 /DNA_START=482 /DNA_END=2281 /DNA_ORIENTATION=-